MSQSNWTSKALSLAKLASLVGASLLFAVVAFAQGKPEKLECESLVTPLGVDTKQPILSWQLRDTRFGAKQTAYQIQVASAPALVAGHVGVLADGIEQRDAWLDLEIDALAVHIQRD